MLIVFVEGLYDERYFERVYGASFREKYGDVKIIWYAGEKTKKINGYLKTIPRLPHYEYLFFGDADGKSLDERRADIIGKFTALSPERVFVVQYEIESWYYAGVDETFCNKNRLKHYEYRTDMVTKEDLYRKLPANVERFDILMEMLKQYSLTLAVQRNHSLSYFDQFFRAVCAAGEQS